MPPAIDRSILEALSESRGHFVFESGHHGDLWLELDSLFIDARRARGWARSLARRAASCRPELACGPLTGGAFVAQAIAAELGAGFVFAERFVGTTGSCRYRIPESLRAGLKGKRVLLVDDAVNAGSAWLSTLVDLSNCGAEVVGFACLLALGEGAARLASRYQAPLFTLAARDHKLWPAEECPLCRSGVPLSDRSGRSPRPHP